MATPSATPPTSQDDGLAARDLLMAQVLSSSSSASTAGDRIMVHRSAGTIPDALDHQLIDTWLRAVVALARLTCDQSHPQMKANGALLNHLADTIVTTLGIDDVST